MSLESYNKNNPFYASIKERVNLCLPGSKKNTHHIVLDIQGSGIQYDVGDSIAVFPVHCPDLVVRTIQAMKSHPHVPIKDKITEQIWSLKDFLTKKVNITEVSRKLLSEIGGRQTNPEKRESIQHLLQEGQRELLKVYLGQRELWQLLIEHEEVAFDPQELCHLLMPLLPRFYSIASSQKEVGDEVHLTVAMVAYDLDDQYERKGVCTNYLCSLAPLYESVVPIYIQPHHGFTLPSDHTKSIIMVGPGTGIAPFRAFMQERISLNAPGNNWLFFGEWTRSHHFFYESYWLSLQTQNKLRIEAAFSRDQEHKVYVQHRIKENAEEFFDWLQQGAYLYVCGDAHRMAKDVDAALHQIVKECGNMDDVSTKAYVKQLRSEKRYLRDVY